MTKVEHKLKEKFKQSQHELTKKGNTTNETYKLQQNLIKRAST